MARGGRTVERLGDHRRACAEHGVAPHTERYLAGRSEGLKSFCTYERSTARRRCRRASWRATSAGASCTSSTGAWRRRAARSRAARPRSLPACPARARALELERLEAATREAEQLEAQLRSLQ